MKLLILGGTSDARKIASALIAQQIEVVYSIAGLVRTPDLNCEVISGGFSQYQPLAKGLELSSGLDVYLLINSIEGVIDATHPFACQMTEHAQQSCTRMNKPYWRFNRAPWQAQQGDNWLRFNTWQPLIEQCKRYQRPLLTTGQIGQQALDEIADSCQQVFYRTAAPSKARVPSNVQWIKALGPFTYEQELALLKQLATDVLVCKNAGGTATSAKLAAARALKLDVIMLDRPMTPNNNESLSHLNKNAEHLEFDSLEALLSNVSAQNN